MFDAFELQPDVSAIRKRVTVAFVAASFVLGGFVVLVAVVASSRPLEEVKPKQVDVSFRPPPPPPEPVKIEQQPPPPPKLNKPKPPPPPVLVAEALPPPQAAPAPAAAAMVAPKEVPKEAAPESDTAVAAIAVAVGGTGDGSGTALGTNDADESAAPVVASAGSSGPVNLPEDAEPPEPSENNAQPEYPESARTTGQEAKVVLKVVVETDGSVGRVQVLKGEEPFVSAALAVVKTWKYEPATLEGVPLAVFKIVNVTFSLRE
ncbi:MAG: energy transducer TonB [Archangium sp.]|nr:energy transducer TonB [Archangium sp.]